MNETDRIADQLKRAFYGEAWSGPSVKEVLEGVTAEMAAKRPIQDAHSIWETLGNIWTTRAIRKNIRGRLIEWASISSSMR